MSTRRYVERAAVTAVGICLALSTLSCGKFFKKKGLDAGAATTAATSQDGADEQMGVKLDEYIKCLNKVGTLIYRSRDRYFATVPNGPPGNDRADIHRIAGGATSTCFLGVTSSTNLPPSDPKLESAGLEYALAAQAADALVTQLATYFETKGFKADKWERGKTLHPQVVAAFKRFSAADRALHEAVDGITKPMAQRTLARIEAQDGKKFRYGRRKVLITARELIEASDPVGEDKDVDYNLFNQTYGEFEKALDELTLYGSMHKADLSNPQLRTTVLADTNYTAFIREANDFKKASKDFWQCLRNAPAASKSPSGKIDRSKVGRCTDGSFAVGRSEDAVKNYNEFIITSNNQPFP